MEAAIQKLLQGFRKFRQNYFNGTSSLFDQLKHGQSPKVLVVACSDSRVDPALLLNCDPGDIFVIRNVANLVPPYAPDCRHHGVSAALEYAVKSLNVEHIIILGHSDCGGIKALMKRDKSKGVGENEFLDSWLDLAEPAKIEVESKLHDASENTKLRACEEASLILGLENLLTFPWVQSAIEKGSLSIHIWYFHLASGQLFYFDQQECKYMIFDRGNEHNFMGVRG